MQIRTLCIFFVLSVFSSACDNPQDTEAPFSAMSGERHIQRFEQWSPYDDPTKLGEFEHRMSALPLSGEVAVKPWPGSYYPVYMDSINYRWGGTDAQPASAKYELAFGGSGIEDAISKNHGVNSSSGAPCTSSAQCSGENRCARRWQHEEGRCTPIWWGLGHAWAAASTLHAEPRHAVTHNDVTFDVPDIKALLTFVYNTPETTQVSLRCEEPPARVAVDRAMRPIGSACRDTNPGTYHILLTNLIGLQKKTFIEDRSIDRAVWNVPLHSYEILAQQDISETQALRLLGLGNSNYAFNSAAKRWAYVKTKVRFVQNARHDIGFAGDNMNRHIHQDIYEYVLELDDNSNIIGGEWLGRSKLDHPDFVWVAHGPNAKSVLGGRMTVENVLDLARRSVL